MDRLAAVDTATLDELARIKAEEETLLARLERLAGRRETTSAAVIARIEGDYRRRLAELAAEARPLKEGAAREYRKLVALQETLAAELDTARLDREEQEVRHEVGELDDAAFAARLEGVDAAVGEREAALADAEALRARFLGAVRDGSELEPRAEEAPLPEEPPLALEPPPAPPPPAPDPEAITRPFEPLPSGFESPPPVPGPGLESEPEPEDEGTVILPRRAVGGAPEGAIAGSHTATLMIPPARIVCQEEGYEEEYLLGPSTLVGRTYECQVRIPHPALSRRHARIDLLPDGGYLLADLGSENGTLVNGERVGEQRLADGDQVQLGTLRFLFRVG